MKGVVEEPAHNLQSLASGQRHSNITIAYEVARHVDWELPPTFAPRLYTMTQGSEAIAWGVPPRPPRSYKHL